MRYASYSRTSSDKQKQDATISTQFDAIAQYAKLHKIQIADRYVDDGISSRIPMESRPDGSRLLRDAERKLFDRLLVFKLDRLARKAQMQLNVVDTIESCGVKILSITEPLLNETSSSTGAFLRTMIAGVGQFERDTFKERSMAGHHAKARLGQWQGGKAPFGYRIGEDHRLQIHHEQAKVVREIFALYLSGHSSQAIADILNDRGVLSPHIWMGGSRGGLWHSSTITEMLRRPTYQGTATWRKSRGVEHKGQTIGRVATSKADQVDFAVPAIVTPEIWLAAREECATHNHFATGTSKRQYELGGLIRCGECGHAYIGKKTVRQKIHYYYDCSGKIDNKGPDRCTNKLVRGLELEERVWAEIVGYSKHPESWELEAKKHAAAELEVTSPAEVVANLDKRIEECRSGRARVITLSRRGAINEDEAVTELETIAREQAGLESSKAKYQAQMGEADKISSRIQEGVRLLAYVKPDADLPVRIKTFRKLIKQILVYRMVENGKSRVRCKVEYGIFQVSAGRDGKGCSSQSPALLTSEFEFEDNRKYNGNPTWNKK